MDKWTKNKQNMQHSGKAQEHLSCDLAEGEDGACKDGWGREGAATAEPQGGHRQFSQGFEARVTTW